MGWERTDPVVGMLGKEGIVDVAVDLGIQIDSSSVRNIPVAVEWGLQTYVPRSGRSSKDR